MSDFYETILLDDIKYKGNPIVKHIELDRKPELKPIDFDQLILLWETTIKLYFEETRLDGVIKRVNLMKELMLYKITQSKNNNFIQ
jgi:hemoglobin